MVEENRQTHLPILYVESFEFTTGSKLPLKTLNCYNSKFVDLKISLLILLHQHDKFQTTN